MPFIVSVNFYKYSLEDAFLDNSPLDSWKIPTDVNKGISGALLSSYRILKKKRIKLYWVGPFLFASENKLIPVCSNLSL
ncbi:hypothetical protein EZV62_025706 [Acer yangbiense]|uniref:Uncharacterized protein n=1 Tax=Acer yangbiense TaxID=1000413 RepID=A0A5C7GZ08_9ROSI|nr:hypothetical protein EZV62_025706 [Acer yangbiense]